MSKALRRVFVDGLIDNESKLLLKNTSSSRMECKYHTLFDTKMAKMDTLFLIKTAENP